MTDPLAWAVPSLAALAGLVVVTVAALKGWRDWLALQRQLAISVTEVPSAAGRIELADLRERVRKLEAIAAGVDW